MNITSKLFSKQGRVNNFADVYGLHRRMQNVKIKGLSSEIPFEEKLDYCLKENRLPYNLSKDEARFKTLDRIQRGAADIQKTGVSMFVRVAAGLVVLILGSAVAYYFVGMSVIENDSDRSAQYTLPDGSLVKLNNQTVAYYNASVWFLNRKIKLMKGEAFFDVMPGEKFTVETEMGDVSVLGTSFNVNVKEGNLKVACKSGSVQVKMPGSKEPIVLLAGKGLDGSISRTEILNMDSDKIGMWADTIYHFDDSIVTEVFEKLQNETDFTFVISDNIHSKYSGQINLNLPIEEILEIVCIPSGLKYSVDPDVKKIYITKIQ